MCHMSMVYLLAQTAQTSREEARDDIGDLCNSAQVGQAVAVSGDDASGLQHDVATVSLGTSCGSWKLSWQAAFLRACSNGHPHRQVGTAEGVQRG